MTCSISQNADTFNLSAPPKWKPLSCVQLFATPWAHTVHEILQARILEWVAFPFSRGSSRPRDRTQVSRIVHGFFTTREPLSAPTKGTNKPGHSHRHGKHLQATIALFLTSVKNSPAGLELHSFTTMAEIMSAFPFQIPCVEKWVIQLEKFSLHKPCHILSLK